MKCPKCDSDMESIKYQAIEVDRCKNCRGIWFDVLEKEQLKALEGAEVIDVGDASVGNKSNKLSDISCPVCHSKMIRMVDNKQHHIWYEACSTCYGIFFDAGEFRDYKEETVLDFFKDLVTRERP